MTMTEAEVVGLHEALVSLGLTPRQQEELEADPDRAWGWVVWARDKRLTNPPAAILTKFRSGEAPPDPNAWRGGTAGSAPNYSKLLETCEALVRNTAHEYLDEDLLDEFEKAGRSRRGGNGAILTDSDRERLLTQAQSIRARQPEPNLDDRVTWAVVHYAKLLTQRAITDAWLTRIHAERWSDVPDFAERVRELLSGTLSEGEATHEPRLRPAGLPVGEGTAQAEAQGGSEVGQNEGPGDLSPSLSVQEQLVAATTTTGKEEHVDLDF